MRSNRIGEICPTQVFTEGLPTRMTIDEMTEHQGDLLVLTSRMRSGEVGMGAATNFAVVRSLLPTEQPEVYDASLMISCQDRFVDVRAYFVDGLWRNAGVVRLHGARPVSGYLSSLAVHAETVGAGLITARSLDQPALL